MGRQLRRVPLDFSHPVGEIWEGFLNPHHVATKCETCEGNGYSPIGRQLHDAWYGYTKFDPVAHGSTLLTVDHPRVRAFAERNCDRSPEYYLRRGEGREAAIVREATRLSDMWNNQWCHHLNQMDVDALVDSNRLWDFTRTFVPGEGWKDLENAPIPTAQQVNDWSLDGFGHDSINQWVVLKAYAYRRGLDTHCPDCAGHGEIWPSEEARELYENWEQVEPPTGEGYQMWETTTEGSPISPVFAKPEELAHWLVFNRGHSIDRGTTFTEWMNMIVGDGWAPSMIVSGGKVQTGVEALYGSSDGEVEPEDDDDYEDEVDEEGHF